MYANQKLDLEAFKKSKDEGGLEKYCHQFVVYANGELYDHDFSRGLLEKSANEKFGDGNYSMFFIDKHKKREVKK